VAKEISNAELFNNLTDKAERCFTKSKQLDFLDPLHGFIGTLIGIALSIIGFNTAGALVLGTTIVVSIVGIILNVITHSLFMRGMRCLDKTLLIGLDFNLTHKEICRRHTRTKEILDSSMKPRRVK
jgi:hypothetical protein